MSATSFDDLDQDGDKGNKNDKPLWALNLDDKAAEKDVLTWCKQERDFLVEQSKDRIDGIKQNSALYKGIQYLSQDTRSTNNSRSTSDRDKRASSYQKIVANHLFDLTEHLVSRDVKYKPAVAILPEEPQFEKELAAEEVDHWIQDVWYRERFEDRIVPKISRCRRIHGDAFLFITFDKDKGELHPDYQALKGQADAQGKSVALPDENGRPQIDERGKELKLDKEVYIGDVSYEVEFAWNVFMQQATEVEQSEYVLRKRCKPTALLRLEHPDLADKIKDTKGDFWFDITTMEMKPLKSQVVYWELYYKPVKAMPNGRKIMFTDDVILENAKIDPAYKRRKVLPCIKVPDIETPGELYGRSFYENVKGLTATYNNITNLIVRNQMLASHPKWVMPAGACKIDSLGNDITIVQYKGPVAPKLETSNPTPSELFLFRDKVKEDFQQIAAVFGVSRGEPPKGIDAGVALQFLNEQENDRHNSSTLGWNAFVVQTVMLTIDVCAENYDETDKRTYRMQGKDGKWKRKVFNPKHLQPQYDIRIQNSSAFQYSKTARMNTLVWLQEKYPTKISPEQVLDLVEFAQVDKYIDLNTAAIKSAEAENHMLMRGEKVNEPKAYEKLILHWQTHVAMLQQYSYKNDTPEPIQQAMEDHVLATEMLMAKKGEQNATFLQMLQQLDMFPIFWKLKPTLPEPKPEDVAAAEGAQGTQEQAPQEQMPGPQFPGVPEPKAEEQEAVNPEPAPTENQIEGAEPNPGPLPQ